MIYLDTETCGLTGPIVLLQYAEDDGPVTLYHVWREPIWKTIQLLERICNDTVCGFNLVFDWFHVNKLYNLFSHYRNSKNPPTPEMFLSCNHTAEYCLKPKAAIDLFLISRKSHWQVLMDRKDIIIKRVPKIIAAHLANVLQNSIPMSKILFARSNDGYQWKVEEIENDPIFCNVVLRFKPSGALKSLASEIFKCKVYEYPIPAELFPEEQDYNPLTMNWKEKIHAHMEWWYNNKQARVYAEQDILLLQRLYHYWNKPAPDTDSALACAVGATRWRGFKIDLDKIYGRWLEKFQIIEKPPVNVNSHHEVKRYLADVATDTEKVLLTSTSAEVLDAIAEFPTEMGIRAKEVRDIRKAYKEIDLLTKLKDSGRFHPSFKIIGTKSGRMSGGLDFGSSSLNPQGINRDKAFRELFILANHNEILSGGDFEQFEVTIADAAYNDRNLHQELESKKSIHALFGEVLYDEDYDEVLKSKYSPNNMYNPAKNSVFALFYGAQEKKISETAGVSFEKAGEAYSKFIERYPGVGKSRKQIFDAFCSMRQPGGLGTKIIWQEPAEYVESLLGFRRYFTLENSIVRTLFALAQNPPDSLDALGSVIRRDRTQSVKGATQSALYAAAFLIQAQNMKAAANHVIQSTGAEITKEVQLAIWNKQQSGVHPWFVSTMNIHDEILVVHQRPVDDAVRSTIEKYRKVIPLLSIDWKTNLKNWGEK